VGAATTKRLPLAGKRLLVNVVTRGEGNLRAELLDRNGAVVKGYSGNECRLIAGDEAAATVEWNEQQTIPDTATRVRFLLNRAFLYGFAVRD